jgi:tetratricopeptide (TPR) repeat protein
MDTGSGSPGPGEETIARTTARLLERPGDDAAHAERATALLDLGRLEEAERDAADAVRIDPDEVRYRELLAEIQSRRGEHADAAAEYARLARRDPHQVAWTVAEAAERMDAADAEKGVEAARRAVRLDPGNFDARLALARGLIRLGDAASALPAATRASDLRPGDANGREAVADALWLAGREAAAFDEFEVLAGEMAGRDRERILAKARSLYRQRAGWFGRLVSATAPIFGVAFRRGWLTVR